MLIVHIFPSGGRDGTRRILREEPTIRKARVVLRLNPYHEIITYPKNYPFIVIGDEVGLQYMVSHIDQQID